MQILSNQKGSASARSKKFDDPLRREGERTDITIRNCWHKPLQRLCGCAVTAELIDKNPYTVFRPKVGHSKPRNPLTADELMLLRRAALPAALARVRDLFIFCAIPALPIPMPSPSRPTTSSNGTAAELAGKIRVKC